MSCKVYFNNACSVCKFEIDHYKKHNYKPNADAIMVFGKRMKDGYSKIQNFDGNKIFVTGAPRLDRWRSIETNSQSSNEGLVIISFMFRETSKPFLSIFLSHQ